MCLKETLSKVMSPFELNCHLYHSKQLKRRKPEGSRKLAWVAQQCSTGCLAGEERVIARKNCSKHTNVLRAVCHSCKAMGAPDTVTETTRASLSVA